MTTRALEQVAADLWVAEGPLRYLEFEMGRRMAVIRLSDGGLLVHSPIELTDALRRQLDRLGGVRFVVPASNLHGHLFMEQYVDAYPGVSLFAAPGLAEKRADLSFDGELSGCGFRASGLSTPGSIPFCWSAAAAFAALYSPSTV